MAVLSSVFGLNDALMNNDLVFLTRAPSLFAVSSGVCTAWINHNKTCSESHVNSRQTLAGIQLGPMNQQMEVRWTLANVEFPLGLGNAASKTIINNVLVVPTWYGFHHGTPSQRCTLSNAVLFGEESENFQTMRFMSLNSLQVHSLEQELNRTLVKWHSKPESLVV